MSLNQEEQALLLGLIQEETTQIASINAPNIDFLMGQMDIATQRENVGINVQRSVLKKYNGMKKDIKLAEQRDCNTISRGLTPHQKFLSQYYQESHKNRGILLYHGTGTGKTITSIAMTNNSIKKHKIKNIIVFLPASLKDNFKMNVVKYNKMQFQNRANPLPKDIPITYISSNGNTKELEGLTDNTLVIMDECQIFASLVSNHSRNSVKIYNQLFNSKCRIIALSATPVINSVFELWLILALCIVDKKAAVKRLLDKESFYNKFYSAGTVSNEVEFYTFINGTISHYDPPKNESTLYPSQNMHMEYLAMEKEHSDTYIEVLGDEPECVTECKKSGKKGMARYYVNSRQYITNAFYTTPERGWDDISDQDIGFYSPKFKALLDHIRASPGPVIVFSFFIEKVLNEVKRLLDTRFPESRIEMYTGSTSTEGRERLIKEYNTVANIDGSVIKVLLISGAGAEGISLRNTRQAHILEPHWNETKIKQAIGRAVRLCSHSTLPKEDQVVDVYRYFGKEYANPDAPTVDDMVYNVAKKKVDFDEKLMDFIHSASIDCLMYDRGTCFE